MTPDFEKVALLSGSGRSDRYLRMGRHFLNAEANDPRIKATAAVSVYDMPRVGAWGYFDKGTAEDRSNKE